MTDSATVSSTVDADADRLRSVAAERDLAAFISLFTHYGPKLKSYLKRRGAGDQQAEELSQETLLLVWRKADRFDPARASASAWIFSIARNLWIDVIRHERIAQKQPADGAQDDCPTPADILFTREKGMLLRKAMASLPPERLVILKLAFFDELSHTEIADQIGLPVGTVKSRIRLATAELRRVLQDIES